MLVLKYFNFAFKTIGLIKKQTTCSKQKCLAYI